MRNLLWIGDAAVETGFARATHATCDRLAQDWNVTILGLNYRGDPHDYPYQIYPAWSGGDMFGIGRIEYMMEKLRPRVVVVQNDPWNFPAYVDAIEKVTSVPRPKIIGSVAIDGKNCRGYMLNGLDHAIFWTEFGRAQAIRGGFNRDSSVVPLGVDLEIFKPGDKLAARRDALELPEFTLDGFIVGNVNRNQPRKRIDLSISYFVEWVATHDIKDAFLYLHVAPTGEQFGYGCAQLFQYYANEFGIDLAKRLILAEPAVFKGASEKHLAATYHAFDVQINTGVGEGWGLTTLEGMACGIPQIAGKFAALGEWCGNALYGVPVTDVVSINKVNVVGGVPDKDAFIEALDILYRSPGMRYQYAERGLSKAHEPQFRWPNIAEQFTAAVNAVADGD